MGDTTRSFLSWRRRGGLPKVTSTFMTDNGVIRRRAQFETFETRELHADSVDTQGDIEKGEDGFDITGGKL